MTTASTLEKIPTEQVTLANGSTLLFRRLPGAPRLGMTAYIYGGNRIESQPGFADMIDDLLEEGTHKRSPEQIAVDMDSLSLDLDFDTRRDYTMLSATLLEEDADECLELVADQLFNSTLADVEKEKIRLHGELMMDLDSPKSRSHDLLMTSLFQNTPYRATNTNILKTLETMTSGDELISHYNRVYHPRNMLFSVVGDTTIDQVKPLIERHFQREGQEIFHEHTDPLNFSIDKSDYVTDARDESAQLHIYKAWYAPPMSHEDYPAMVVLNTILGGAGLTSRLFLELRDKQGLAYVVRSQYETSRYTGVFSLYIGTEPSNREKALKGFEVECDKLMQVPVGAQELADAKENIQGRRVVFLETALQQASYVGNAAALGMSTGDLEAMPARIQAVTSDDVQRVAQLYWQKNAIISAVGPSTAL